MELILEHAQCSLNMPGFIVAHYSLLHQRFIFVRGICHQFRINILSVCTGGKFFYALLSEI